MKLNKRTDFVLRTLIYLARQPEGERVFVQDISEAYNIPNNHLTKIVNQLGQMHYIKTYRGRGGGIELAKPKEEIMLKQVIIDFEPEQEIIDCRECALRKHNCKLEYHLKMASKAFLNSMANISLADLV